MLYYTNIIKYTCVATALANIVLPVPGGPYNNIPCHGVNKPVNNCGYWIGICIASRNIAFASSKPIISFQWTFGLWE